MALFEARGLHKRFGDHVVLDNVSLAFEEGQLSGIMGPNGAGKTTCFNVLTGRYKPDRGHVVFAGTDITGLSPRRIAQQGLARSFQVMNHSRSRWRWRHGHACCFSTNPPPGWASKAPRACANWWRS